jgi:hypothetical protein
VTDSILMTHVAWCPTPRNRQRTWMHCRRRGAARPASARATCIASMATVLRSTPPTLRRSQVLFSASRIHWPAASADFQTPWSNLGRLLNSRDSIPATPPTPPQTHAQSGRIELSAGFYCLITVPSRSRISPHPPLSGLTVKGALAASFSSISMPQPGFSLTHR